MARFTRAASRTSRLRTAFRSRLERLEDRVVPNVTAVSLSDPSLWGDTGFGLSAKPSMSADGQRIVFESAVLLHPGLADDRGTGRTSLVSVNAAGTYSGNNAGIRTAPSVDACASPPTADTSSSAAPTPTWSRRRDRAARQPL